MRAPEQAWCVCRLLVRTEKETELFRTVLAISVPFTLVLVKSQALVLSLGTELLGKRVVGLGPWDGGENVPLWRALQTSVLSAERNSLTPWDFRYCVESSSLTKQNLEISRPTGQGM